jgi:hypothetical protein
MRCERVDLTIEVGGYIASTVSSTELEITATGITFVAIKPRRCAFSIWKLMLFM